MEFNNSKVISRVVDATFPDYKQIIPKTVQIEATLLKNDLLKGIRATQVFTDNFNQVRFNFNPKSKANFLADSRLIL